jgi:hypothetical protein
MRVDMMLFHGIERDKSGAGYEQSGRCKFLATGSFHERAADTRQPAGDPGAKPELDRCVRIAVGSEAVTRPGSPVARLCALDADILGGPAVGRGAVHALDAESVVQEQPKLD